jgi:ureidoacrylate peracid hydrolase
MHAIAIPDHAIAAALKRRGKLHLYDTLLGPATALVVIDLQNAFMLPGMPAEVPLAREIVPNVNRLAAGIRSTGGTVAWVKMTIQDETRSWSHWFDYFMSPERKAAMLEALSRGEPGHQLHAGLDVKPSDLTVEKTRYSAFIQGSSDLDKILRGRGIDTVVVAGTLTNVCSESTARDAMMLNYKTVFVSDANATLTDAEHNATLGSILQVFGDVMTTDEVLARLSTETGRSAAKTA